jgi:hypothetical protein
MIAAGSPMLFLSIIVSFLERFERTNWPRPPPFMLRKDLPKVSVAVAKWIIAAHGHIELFLSKYGAGSDRWARRHMVFASPEFQRAYQDSRRQPANLPSRGKSKIG